MFKVIIIVLFYLWKCKFDIYFWFYNIGYLKLCRDILYFFEWDMYEYKKKYVILNNNF